MINNSMEKESKNATEFRINPKHITDSEQLEIVKLHSKNATFASGVYRNLPKIASVFSVSVGILVIIGWIFDISFLKSVYQDMVTMKPNTAVCFILSGAALWLIYDKNSGNISIKIGKAFSIAVFAIGFLIVCEYFFGVDFGIDYFLFREKVSAEKIQWVGRMSVISAIMFSLVALALFLSSFKNIKLHYLSQLIVLLIAISSLIIFSGFIYGVRTLYEFSITSAIAFHTTVCFFVISVGVLFVDEQRGFPQIALKNSFGGVLIRRLIPAALIFPFILSWLKQKGVEAELYSPDFGTALVASANIFVFATLIILAAKSLDEIDEQRKKAQDAVRTSLKELADIKFAFDESAIIVITDQNGKISYVNDFFCKVSKYSREEVIGKNHHYVDTGYHPQEFIDSIWTMVRNGEIWRGELRNLAKDGSIYWADTTIVPLSNEEGTVNRLVIIRYDITNRKIAEEKTLEERIFSDFTINSLPAVFYLYDSNRKFLRWNKNFEEVSGYSGEEIAKMHPLDFFAEDEKKVLEDRIAEVFEKDEAAVAADFLSKKGRRIPYFFTGKKVFYKNQICLVGMGIDMTDLRETETALRHSEERYRDLFENNPFPMWVYELDTLRFVAVNGAATHHYGYTEEEFRSMTIKDIRPLDEIPALLENVAQPAKTIENSGVWKHLKKDGTIIFVEITSHELVFDGKLSRLVLVNDITKKKLAEEKLIESQRQFRELSESLPQLIWTCRGDGYCDYLSPQWVEYTGKPEAEQLGSEWLKQIHPEDRETAFSEWNNAIEAKGSLDVEFRIRRWDGVYRWFKTQAVSYKDEEGNIYRWFGTNTDIEESKQAREKILLLNETLEQRVFERTAELETSNKELESFSYSVSHDLRAPLRAIDGFSQALIEDCSDLLNDEGKHYLGRVRSASQQMAILIEDLLNLSRVTRREINRTEVDLSNLADTIAENLQDFNPERKVKFNIEERIIINGDEGLLRIVLENLIGNAWKFTSKTKNAEITFGQQFFDEKLWVFVKDNGAGFNMNYVDKLFGAFQRLHNKNEFEGTGIGLATVQRILNRHGGSVRAEGKIGEGAVFYFTI